VRATLNADGGARGNPGPAGIGVVLRDSDGIVIDELARGIGVATNNVAEYEAVIAGLELALAKGVTELEILVDSELVAAQLEGRWKIKNDRLRGLAVRARALMSRFDSVSIRHVRRTQNAPADRLANIGMDESEARGYSLDGPEQSSLLE
jgi:ribonuclease H / adenosylcobalamin/alpha-ribazole phosphatase